MRPELINLGTRLPAKTRNNGHSPKFETDYNVIGLRGVPFSHQDLYFFKELHPHIGNTFQSGSEHSVDGNFKPMEIHMVFWNSNYRDIVHAKSKPRGLAVIGVNVEVGDPADDIYVEEQEKYNPLPPQHIYNKCTCTNDFFYGHVCRQLGLCRCSSDKDCPFGGKCRSLGRVPYCGKPHTCRVRYAHKFSQLAEKYFPLIEFPEKHASHRGEMRYLQVPEGVTPEDALPYDGGFYTYRGSLTTPPCFETVQWIMMRCPIKVSRAAYHALAMMRDVRGNFLSRDGVKRPIQRGLPGFPPIQVYRNFLWETTGKEVPFYDVSEIQKNNVY
ncbi:nacrein-like protein [Ostrea edulis]|uniref:nacrein-like protein n=1 Tax=Ostrea edulis TaxID=37623 RepID=UPI0024AF7545|nr:nacrein-like protein [Ostrea edulis]